VLLFSHYSKIVTFLRMIYVIDKLGLVAKRFKAIVHPKTKM